MLPPWKPPVVDEFDVSLLQQDSDDEMTEVEEEEESEEDESEDKESEAEDDNDLTTNEYSSIFKPFA